MLEASPLPLFATTWSVPKDPWHVNADVALMVLKLVEKFSNYLEEHC